SEFRVQSSFTRLDPQHPKPELATLIGTDHRLLVSIRTFHVRRIRHSLFIRVTTPARTLGISYGFFLPLLFPPFPAVGDLTFCLATWCGLDGSVVSFLMSGLPVGFMFGLTAPAFLTPLSTFARLGFCGLFLMNSACSFVALASLA